MAVDHVEKRIFLGIFFLVVLSLTACGKQPSTETPIGDVPIITESPTFVPSRTPTTPLPASLYLDETLPPDLMNSEVISAIKATEDPGASLWLGERSQAPDGETLASASWVFALAAPFPTRIDDVTETDLQNFWQGDREAELNQVAGLYVPEYLKTVLTSRWGRSRIATVTFFDAAPDINLLWEENAWIILPFESLHPKLKVISVDGISPLFKDFKAEKYALTVQYDLIQNEGAPYSISESDLQSVMNSFQSTNRDPDKMTTLVMTGVTALVRATAYRMEINGATYPGEEIVEWLSEADLTHISNEVSFYEKCPFPNPNSRMLLFCSNPDYIELFDYIGADIIELTGNHNNDSWYVYGVDVVPFTLDLYQEHGMAYFGGGLDLEDAMTPFLISHNGNQLAFIGCNSPGPDFAWATEDHGGAMPCGDLQWMAEEINRLSEKGYLTIATFQYYENYSNIPSEQQISDFGLVAEAGAVIVNGSQAHRPKGMAFVEDAFVDYGLGNLFFDQMGIVDDYGNRIIQTRWEIIQRHTFYDGRHLSTELLTAMLEDYAQPRPMTTRERLKFLEELFTASGWESR
jgi:poly-gamma-glutamate synthesis protein (capsule biosynthesis protein)